MRLHDPDNGVPLDDAIVLWLPGPASVTGEDVAELQVHGSRAVLDAVMRALRRRGLRLAEPGEFTRRALLNGKLDLTQAEAIADLAAADTEAQRLSRHCASSMAAWAIFTVAGAGGYCGCWRISKLRSIFRTKNYRPDLEAEVAVGIATLLAAIEGHLADDRRGERLRDGIAVAIVGPPNAGKSSLLNQLAGREAAITSPLAGTTRDVIEVAIDLAGYPVVIADTAGLRESTDRVEQEGLRRALARADAADLRLFVFDAQCPEDAAGAAQWSGKDTLLVANKIDLVPEDARRCRRSGRLWRGLAR